MTSKQFYGMLVLIGLCTLSALFPYACTVQKRFINIENRLDAIENDFQTFAGEPCEVYTDFEDYVNAINQAICAIAPKNTDRNFILALAQIIAFESLRNNFDPFLIIAIIDKESKFNPNARSRADAIGLMQIHSKSWHKHFGYKSIHDFEKVLVLPRMNIYYGIEVFFIHADSCPNSLIDSLNCYNGRRLNNRYGKNVLDLRDELFNAFGEDLP